MDKKTNQLVCDGEVQHINALIQGKQVKGINKGLISDGNHTFDELYEHRNMLFIALCNLANKNAYVVWKSKNLADGTKLKKYFILGIGIMEGYIISYHIPNSKWELCKDITTLPTAVYFGHTSEDVLELLQTNF